MALVNQSHRSQTTANSSDSFPTFNRSIELETFKLVFQSLIAIVGVIGNLAVCIVVTRNKQTKSSTELLIRNLAIADLGVVIVIFPLAVIKERIPLQWPLGEFFCLSLYPCTETFYSVSVWTIVVIAVERYRHLNCPVLKERMRTIKTVKRLIICLWLGCFLLFSAPLFHFMKFEELNPGRIFCQLRFPSTKLIKAYMIFLLVAWYCLPLLMILWTYFAISRKLNQSNVFLRSMNTSESNLSDVSDRSRNRLSMQHRRLQQNRRVKKVLTPVVVVFAALMLPVNVFKTYVVFDSKIANTEHLAHVIYFISTCFILNSSINPVIYSFVSPGFRAGLRAFVKNRTARISIVAGSAIRAVGERMTFKMRHRRTYSLNNKGTFRLKSVKSDQTPLP